MFNFTRLCILHGQVCIMQGNHPSQTAVFETCFRLRIKFYKDYTTISYSRIDIELKKNFTLKVIVSRERIILRRRPGTKHQLN